MKQIQLTEEQAKNTMQLLDLAVKAGGLNASVLALPIAQEIEKQLTEEKK
jgi:hypothetical protein